MGGSSPSALGFCWVYRASEIEKNSELDLWESLTVDKHWLTATKKNLKAASKTFRLKQDSN